VCCLRMTALRPVIVVRSSVQKPATSARRDSARIDRAACPRDTRISCSRCAQRDREMDGPDQGARGDRGVSRTVFVGLAHARKRNGPGPCLRWKGPKIFIGCTRSGASVTRNDRPYRAEARVLPPPLHAMPAHPASLHCDHLPPHAAGMSRSSNPAAIPRNDSQPAACSSLMVGRDIMSQAWPALRSRGKACSISSFYAGPTLALSKGRRTAPTLHMSRAWLCPIFCRYDYHGRK
jgi:hypothetical protein